LFGGYLFVIQLSSKLRTVPLRKYERLACRQTLGAKLVNPATQDQKQYESE
jgi:hypothetical protein